MEYGIFDGNNPDVDRDGFSSSSEGRSTTASHACTVVKVLRWGLCEQVLMVVGLWLGLEHEKENWWLETARFDHFLII